jgi:fructokinase
VVVDGKVLAGPNGLAGEWGHTPLPWAAGDELPGPLCYCGKHGCLETWISGTGLANDFARVTGRDLRGEEIVAAAEKGDAEAMAALDRLEDRMARGLAVVVNILDPDVIVVGGGLSKLERLYSGVQARLGDLCFGGGAETPLVRAMYGDSSGVRGAAWLWNPER